MSQEDVRRPRRVTLTPEQIRANMESFPDRKDDFIAYIRGDKSKDNFYSKLKAKVIKRGR